jgi:hypothetical protein
VRGLLEELLTEIPAGAVAGLAVTGSGSSLVAEALGVQRVNDFQAIARAIGRLHPTIRTVFEMGGETSKYIRLEPDPSGRGLNVVDSAPTVFAPPAPEHSSTTSGRLKDASNRSVRSCDGRSPRPDRRR